MYDELISALREAHEHAMEWGRNPFRYAALYKKAADAIEELSKRVPKTPHGRLIDTDAVSLEGGLYEYDEWCKWALEQYQDAPTVIEAEEALGGLK